MALASICCSSLVNFVKFCSTVVVSRWNCSIEVIDSCSHTFNRPPLEGGCSPLVKLPSRLTISGVLGIPSKVALFFRFHNNADLLTVQTVGRLEQHPHVRPVGQDVLPIQAVGGQLLHPTDESVIALGLQVVDEFLRVYVYPSPLDFCGDHRQTDVDGSVNLAPADLARTLAVNQDAFFYHKVALESKEWKMRRGLGVFLFDIKTKITTSKLEHEKFIGRKHNERKYRRPPPPSDNPTSIHLETVDIY